MKISVITPTVRNVEITARCLTRQSFKDFEWLVVSTKKPLYTHEMYDWMYSVRYSWIDDPGKKEGDFYSLCKAYNAGFKKAKGELIISLQDGIWIDPNTLQHFWDLYEADKKSCVGALGDQYTDIDEYGKPINLHWVDPRRTDKHGSFYKIYPIDIEFTLCSFPRQAVIDVGGMEEEFDKGAAVGEKEMALRMDKAGYKFYLDQTLSYRAIHHPRLTENWDTYYDVACKLYDGYKEEIINGNRLKLNYL